VVRAGLEEVCHLWVTVNFEPVIDSTAVGLGLLYDIFRPF